MLLEGVKGNVQYMFWVSSVFYQFLELKGNQKCV